MKLSGIVVLAIFWTSAFAQDEDLDRLMTRRFITCQDISYNCMVIIPEYLQRSEADSVRMLISYWQRRCGIVEKAARMEILLKIQDGTFNEEFYENNLLDLLLTYKQNAESSPQSSRHYYNDDNMRWSYYSDVYNEHVKKLAKEIMSVLPSGSLESLIAGFYADNFDPLLSALEKNTFPETQLQQKYNQLKGRLTELPEGHLSMLAEYWIPMQQLRVLGNHPGLGFQLGIKKRDFFGDLTLLFRFVKAANHYKVFSQDSLFTTDHFFGGYVGIDIGKVLIRRKQSEFAIVGGVAYDGFDAVKQDQDLDIEAVTIGSLNLNGGFGYRNYYNNHGNYLGLQARFNVVDYSTKGGTDLTGNAITLRLIWGFSGNLYRQNALKMMGVR